MKITGTHLALVSLAFFAGGFIVWLLISLGAKPTEVNVGAIKFGLPPAVPNASQSDAPQSSLSTNPGQPPSTNSSSAPSQPIAEYCYGKCWQYDDNARTMTWTGTKDGIEDIWQADGEPLEKIRAGYTAYFEISFPMKMEICMGSIDGVLFSRQCKFQVIDIAAGRHTIVSAGPQGGFRVRPQ